MGWLKPERGWLDHAIIALGAAAAGWSIGASVNNVGISLIFSIGGFLSTMLGWAISTQITGSKWAKLDIWLWTIFAGGAFFGMARLNGLLPGEGFPREVLAASAMGFMMVFCGAVSWRDETLLFLSMPILALFVLTGAIDSFAMGVVFFSLFIIGAQFLYARVHRRSMLAKLAANSGEDFATLRRGPWRWMAGPEWAFGSALATILVGLILAPLFQSSVGNVAAGVRVTLNQAVNQQRGPAANRTETPEVTVGNGPTTLSDEIVFRVKLDRPRYLRTAIYERYENRGWRSIPPAQWDTVGATSIGIESAERSNDGMALGYPIGQQPLEPMDEPERVSVTIRSSVLAIDSLPTPGPVLSIEPTVAGLIRPDGQVIIRDGIRIGRDLSFSASAPPPVPPTSARARLTGPLTSFSRYYLNLESISPRLTTDIARVTEGETTDLARAFAAQQWITSQVRYNLNAARIPADADPVEHFLYTSKEGYCDLFASAMALAARSMGLPSRVAIGYLLNVEAPDSEGFYTARQRDYHMWAEIYFEGVGWIPFDATAGAVEVEGAGVGDRPNPMVNGLWSQPWFWPALIGGMIVVGGLVGWLASKATRSGAGVAMLKSHPMDRSARQFFRAVEKASGKPRRYSDTVRDFLARSEAALGAQAAAAWEIGRELERWAYGKAEPTKAEAADFKARVEALAKQLKLEAAARK
jgi:transglutaminase-like putative cysteine protease